MAFLRVRTQFLGVTGSPWLNTLNFLGAGSAPTQAEADLAVAKVGAFWGSVDNLMSTTVTWATLPDVAVIELDGVQTGAFSTTPATGAGSAADSILPFATQGLLRLLTNFFIGGRQLRGRIFIPGYTEASSNLGIPVVGATANWTAAGAVLAAATNPRLAVWSPTHTSASAVASTSAWGQWAVLRSRRD
jgi:hypothetical protein